MVYVNYLKLLIWFKNQNFEFEIGMKFGIHLYVLNYIT